MKKQVETKVTLSFQEIEKALRAYAKAPENAQINISLEEERWVEGSEPDSIPYQIKDNEEVDPRYISTKTVIRSATIRFSHDSQD